MLKKVVIRNYKSIENLEIPLGRVNVFIGENGAGKSNILEAIALAGAAKARKLDNEFLVSRGIRVTHPSLMTSALIESSFEESINVSFETTGEEPLSLEIFASDAPYVKWESKVRRGGVEFDMTAILKSFEETLRLLEKNEMVKKNRYRAVSSKEHKKNPLGRLDQAKSSRLNYLIKNPEEAIKNLELYLKSIESTKGRNGGSKFDCLSDFFIFSPENSSLRIFEKEGQIQPLGVNGEGLLKFLSVLIDSKDEALDQIKSALHLLDWFDDFDISKNDDGNFKQMEIVDRFIRVDKKYFDQKCANEGFLYITFYCALFTSKITPKFFAVDNIDASLNPKLCADLMVKLVELAKANDKQILLTTHNPAILDGLNLDDEEQRLFAVERDIDGQTTIERVNKRYSALGEDPERLSEAFLRGMLGGLPRRF